jgi:predicted DNA-binding helix-hairpin-helix protein
LLRDYGWRVEELPFLADGNMRLELDPKRAWAEQHLRHAPIDVMKASRQQLLRVPGIGPKAAEAIIQARRLGHLTGLTDLRKLNIHAVEQVAPYILFDGRRPVTQMQLF